MNNRSNFKNLFVLAFLFTATAMSAQNQIQSTQTDEKHGNTTVVYTKDSNYNDQDILAQLDDSYGIGDVVRIAVAEPKPNTSDMLASNDPAVMFTTPKSVPAATPKVVKETPKKVEAVKVAPVQKTEAAPQKKMTSEVTTAKTVKPVVEQPARKTMKKGSIYRLELVNFDVNKYELKAESTEELALFYTFLKDHPTAVIEVRGHTNNQMWPNTDFANALSTNRAKAVADWLIAKGIAAERVQYKGYGWTMPLEPNINAEGRKKNQRVEVKILNM